MKQNGVVCKPGPALIFFIFQFEYLISGPKSYWDLHVIKLLFFYLNLFSDYFILTLQQCFDAILMFKRAMSSRYLLSF